MTLIATAIISFCLGGVAMLLTIRHIAGSESDTPMQREAKSWARHLKWAKKNGAV